MKRRSFLGFLAASPLAAKQAAEKTAASLANVDVSGLDKSGLVPSGIGSMNMDADALRRMLAITGIPDWKKEDLRDSARYVSHLHHDVAALRSVSLSGKVAIQRGRNYQHALRQFERGWISPPSWVRVADEFRAKHGWPF